MRHFRKTYIAAAGLVLALLFLSRCITTGEPFSGIPPGIWRGVLYLDQGSVKSAVTGSFDERSGAELPFNFEVKYDTPDSFHFELINGSRRIPVRNIRFGLDRETGKDTIEIRFSPGLSVIKGNYEEDAIEGYWILPEREEYKIPFRAIHSKDYLFTELHNAPLIDISGRWDVQWSVESSSPESATAEFSLKGNDLTGTFRTDDNAYRFLEGTVQDNRLFLSSFDGTEALLFEGKILEDGTLSGIFRNGSHEKTYWAAKRANRD